MLFKFHIQSNHWLCSEHPCRTLSVIQLQHWPPIFYQIFSQVRVCRFIFRQHVIRFSYIYRIFIIVRHRLCIHVHTYIYLIYVKSNMCTTFDRFNIFYLWNYKYKSGLRVPIFICQRKFNEIYWFVLYVSIYTR